MHAELTAPPTGFYIADRTVSNRKPIVVPSSSPHAARTRWCRRKEARPAEILDAALHLFVERGFAATRADDVASRAGISKGTLYLYYANKEELFKAVVRETIVPGISQATDRVLGSNATAAALLRELMFEWWAHIGDPRVAGITKLIMAESGNFPEVANIYVDEVVEPAQRLFGGIIARGVASGEFRATDVPMTTHLLMAPMLMLIMWKLSIGPCAQQPLPDPQQYIEHVTDTVLRGLLAQAAR